MTAAQQLHRFGISAEPYDGHVIIRTDRTFQMMTPPEIVGFLPHLGRALKQARRQAHGRPYIARPEGVAT